MFVHFDNSDSGHDQWIEYDEKTMKIASSSGGNKASASSRKDPKPSPAQEPGRDARHFVTRSLMKQLAEKPAPAKKKNTSTDVSDVALAILNYSACPKRTPKTSRQLGRGRAEDRSRRATASTATASSPTTQRQQQ